MTDRAACLARDMADPLAPLRARFRLPDDAIYLDGNSLGPLPASVPARLARVASAEWGDGLIRSWTDAGWWDLPAQVGAKIAPLIGAAADEVVATDSTSVNLFKLLVAALALRPERHVILSDTGNFPTDLYIAQGVRDMLGGHELRVVAPEHVADAIDHSVAVVALTHVDYRTARMHDMAAVTEAAHRAGALMLWDLSHSVGAVPVDLAGSGADLAVGCSYKYLNGGPGAPAWLYVRRSLQADVRSPLSGWWGHAVPFAFAPDYAPADGIARNLCGTQSVLALAALDAALDVWEGIDLQAVRAKSLALCDLFIELVERECADHGVVLASPRTGAARGSHVAFRHSHGDAVMQALRAHGVIGDFRSPDLMRFGFAPLYIRYVDVFDAAARLASVLDEEEWRRAEYRVRAKVT